MTGAALHHAACADRENPDEGRARLLPEPARTPGLEARFWAKVSKSPGPDGCREWTACKNGAGYGIVHVECRGYPAHRIAFWLSTGRWPGELLVLSTCNDRLCCRPDHLVLSP